MTILKKLMFRDLKEFYLYIIYLISLILFTIEVIDLFKYNHNINMYLAFYTVILVLSSLLFLNETKEDK